MPLVWAGEDPRDIPWSRLPERCIAKVNHGSGGHVLLTRDTDRDAAVGKLARSLRHDFYLESGEYHYRGIARKVLIEQLIDDGFEDGPLDYRIWCFHGRPALVQIDNRTHTRTPFFDTDWKLLDIELGFRPRGDAAVTRPANLDRMLEVAARLSDGHDFVRVDLYHVQGRVHFGEMTFTPTRGVLKFRPDAWDRVLGELWLGAPMAPGPSS